MGSKKTISALSPSRAKDFLQCPKLFHYKHVLGIRTPGTQATVRGTLAHYAFEHIFNHPPEERTPETALAYIEPAFDMLLDPLRERGHVQPGSPEDRLRSAEKRYRDLHDLGSPSEQSLLAEAAEIGSIVAPGERETFLETVRTVVRGWFHMESPHRFTPTDRERYVRARIGPATVHGYIDRLDAVTDRGGVDRVFISDYKGLATDTPLPTPTGWTTMERVRVGDRLLGSDGRAVTVTEVTPEQHLRCYRLTFDDSTTIVADEVHLWQRADGTVCSTAELAEQVRAHGAVALPPSPVVTYEGECEPLDETAIMQLRERETVHPLTEAYTALLRAARGTETTRRRLLAAMSTDGQISVRDEAVADKLAEICASIGLGRAPLTRTGGVLSRPWDESALPTDRLVTAVTEVATVPTRCVAVDADDHLYLAGRGMVCTHNTGRKPSERFADEAFFQLEVYAAVLKESDGVDTHQVRLIYTNEAGVDGVLTRTITPAGLDATRKKIISVWNGIERARRDNSWPTRKQRLCDWCHFKPVCPAFHKELEGLLPEEIAERLDRGD